ncbi:hypothetical protein Pmani_020862 [Petrolisthes manimaculis]|uniref:Secreted protein n=1 Tax=Petrolisthes manimaculis TaxID=1843537 RepID=A0AAE1PFW2_9EUCA|nr:hypothetical protein Pmani_020862 [Petrolisthes manimaculis]
MYLAFVLGAPWPALCLASIQLTMFHCAHHSQTDPLDDPFEDAELEALALSDLAVTWNALWHHFLFTVLGCQTFTDHNCQHPPCSCLGHSKWVWV